MSAFQNMDKHVAKRCLYCDLELTKDLPISDFVQHLKEKHPDKVSEKELREYEMYCK